MTKQEEFNWIRKIIENPKNKSQHLEVVRKLIDSFEAKYGLIPLTLGLKKLQTELIKRV